MTSNYVYVDDQPGTDDTAKLANALIASGKDKIAVLSGRTYELEPEKLILYARRLVGVHHWRERQGGTILKIIGEGEWLFDGRNNRFDLERMHIDCDKKCKTPVLANRCAEARCVEVTVANATGPGFHFVGGGRNELNRCAALWCQIGVRLDGSNATLIERGHYHQNEEYGVLVTGQGDDTSLSSGLAIVRDVVAFRNGDGVDHAQIAFRGVVSSSRIVGCYVEQGGSAGQDTDGIRIERCQGTKLLHCYTSGYGTAAKTNVAFRVIDSQRTAIVDCEVGEADGVANGYGRILWDTEEPTVVRCLKARSVTDPVVVEQG